MKHVLVGFLSPLLFLSACTDVATPNTPMYVVSGIYFTPDEVNDFKQIDLQPETVEQWISELRESNTPETEIKQSVIDKSLTYGTERAREKLELMLGAITELRNHYYDWCMHYGFTISSDMPAYENRIKYCACFSDHILKNIKFDGQPISLAEQDYDNKAASDMAWLNLAKDADTACAQHLK